MTFSFKSLSTALSFIIFSCTGGKRQSAFKNLKSFTQQLHDVVATLHKDGSNVAILYNIVEKMIK